MSLFQYIHELKLGRTTSISQHVLGFDGFGNVSNVTSLGYMKTLDEIFDSSVKIISFIDIGGSNKSSKLLARGLCA